MYSSNFPKSLLFPNNFWVVLIFYPSSHQIKEEFWLFQYISCIEMKLLENCKSISPKSMKVVLWHPNIILLKDVYWETAEDLIASSSSYYYSM
jgi:hypothetical protein